MVVTEMYASVNTHIFWMCSLCDFTYFLSLVFIYRWP